MSTNIVLPIHTIDIDQELEHLDPPLPLLTQSFLKYLKLLIQLFLILHFLI